MSRHSIHFYALGLGSRGLEFCPNRPRKIGGFDVNALVIVLGIVAANLGAHHPGIALAFPALMLINATFFHVLPFALTRGRFSPGLITAVVLFYPIGIACYWRASHGGTLRTRALVGSLVLGALLMAAPVVLLKIKNLHYFRQDSAP
jgi:Protein of unknown function with HXXEE motif